MSEKTHEAVKNPETGQVELIPVEKAPESARAWFADEQGYQGEPIEYGGAKFYAREVKKSVLRQFTQATQRIQRETVLLAKQQADELKALQNELQATQSDENSDGGALPVIELSDERTAFYDAESERLIDELDAAYNAMLEAGIVGWNLPRPFSLELLFGFAKVDKVALCQAIGSRSTSGFEAVKNSPGRLKR